MTALRAVPLPARAGSLLVGSIVVVAMLAPLIAPFDPDERVAAPFSPPTDTHLLGTDDVGHDILSQLVFGARVSIGVGVAAALAAILIGSAVGLMAAEMRGWVEVALMRLVDIMLALPLLPLMIVIGAFVGSGIVTQIAVIAAVTWAGPARELRAQTLSVRERSYVEAARAMGAGRRHIILRHLLPAVAPIVVPQAVRAISHAILFETALSFLGLGDTSSISWGTMLFYAHSRGAFLTDAWLWWVLPPGVAVVLTVVGFAMIGYALEERDQRLLDRGPAPGHRPRYRRQTTPVKEVLLSVENLTVRYSAAKRAAVENVSFTVADGEVLGIIGESGGGKTSIARALVGLLPATADVSGAVWLAGEETTTSSPKRWRALRGTRISLVPQDAIDALDPVMRVEQQIVEAILTHRRSSRRAAINRARDLLESVGIPRSRARDFPHQFSGGMRQRAAIAIALANRPSLLIADEPTKGLDLITRAEILQLLGSLPRRWGTAVIIISHDVPAVVSTARRIIVMRRGRIVDEGPPVTLRRRPSNHYTARLLTRIAVRPRTRRPSREVLLKLHGVSKAFSTGGRQRIEALKEVSLDVQRGEIVGLIGNSGAGKSTLARVVAGLEIPDTGAVHLDGKDITTYLRQKRRHLRSRIHLIFQNPYEALPGNFTVEEIVAEPLTIYGLPPAERKAQVSRALAEVDMVPARSIDRRPYQLSGGELQRVALARALVCRPELIVADEPVEMLDLPVRAELLELLSRLRDVHGIACLYISHDLDAVKAIADRVVVLCGGKVVEQGPLEDVTVSPQHDCTAALVHASSPMLPEGWFDG